MLAKRKQQLQYLLFPDGLLYDKKNDTVRTNRINTLFHEIAVNTRSLGKRKKDNPLLNCLFGSNVGMTGLLRDPELGKDAQKPFYFFSKNETVFFMPKPTKRAWGLGIKKTSQLR
jgi:hypothetical protein